MWVQFICHFMNGIKYLSNKDCWHFIPIIFLIKTFIRKHLKSTYYAESVIPDKGIMMVLRILKTITVR